MNTNTTVRVLKRRGSPDKPILVVKRLEKCPRCGRNHRDMTFVPLRRPMEAAEPAYTHWASCPRTGEPILLIATLVIDKAPSARKGR